MERMRTQEAAADSSDLQRRCEELQQQLQQQATAAQAAQLQAAEALQRAQEAADQVGWACGRARTGGMKCSQ